MPLGNLTSQFFANVYLNELDQFVKHSLRATYYVRYVDDFVIFSKDRQMLESYMDKINCFIQSTLNINLHPTKSKIIPLHRGVDFLGFRIFYHHKLLRKSNQKRLKKKPRLLNGQLKSSKITYDEVYDKMLGSIAYAKQANTYNLRKKLESEYELLFRHEISTKEINKMAKLEKRPKLYKQSAPHKKPYDKETLS